MVAACPSLGSLDLVVISLYIVVSYIDTGVVELVGLSLLFVLEPSRVVPPLS